MMTEPTTDDRHRITDSVSRAVVTAIAEVEGVDPIELDAPLYDIVDPEALDALVEDGSGVGVSFTYCGYVVRIEDGHVHVSGSD